MTGKETQTKDSQIHRTYLSKALSLNHFDCVELILRRLLESLNKNLDLDQKDSIVINEIVSTISCYLHLNKSNGKASKTLVSNGIEANTEHKANLKTICSEICVHTECSRKNYEDIAVHQDLLKEITLVNESDSLARIENALEAVKNGEMIAVQDDFSRENEADLIVASEMITDEIMAFMIRESSGVVCVSLTSERCLELDLPQMVINNTEVNRTAFTISVDYLHGTTTGVSASDRVKTIRALIDPKSKPEDFARPGHIFPLMVNKGGIMKRGGHTEASMELVKLAQCKHSAALCELINPDGTMMRTDELIRFSIKHKIKICSVLDIKRYINNQPKNNSV